jgi:GTPase
LKQSEQNAPMAQWNVCWCCECFVLKAVWRMNLNGWRRIWGGSNFSLPWVSQQYRSLRVKSQSWPGKHDRKQKRLDIVLLGKPNSGKSVLLNQLIQTKIAATSRKRQTTRSQILGVFNYQKTQLAFYDTPGFIPSVDANKAEIKRLREITTAAVSQADVVLLVVDSHLSLSQRELSGFGEMVQIAMQGAKQEVILVLNKIDLVNPKSELLDSTWDLVSVINGVKLGETGKDSAELDTTTFMISALENDGVLDMKNYLLSLAKFKPWVISEGNGVSDMSQEEVIEELIRENLLNHTHEEIPYIAGVECQKIVDVSDLNVRVEVEILVDNHRQQKIVVGEKGRTLLKIRQATCDELEKMMNKTVLLFIWVNVRTKNKVLNEEESRV